MMPSKCTGIMSSTTVMCDGARPEQMNTFTPRSCSSCSASMEDCGITCVTKLVSVPSMSKNAALMSARTVAVAPPAPAVMMSSDAMYATSAIRNSVIPSV